MECDAKMIQLIDDIAKEARMLLGGFLKDDKFVNFVAQKMQDYHDNGYIVPDDDLEMLCLLRAAAVRSLDSFDSIPEAEKFINLVSRPSGKLKDNNL